MLNVLGKAHRYCDGLTRRDVLQVGTLAAGGSTLAALLARKAAANPTKKPVPNTAVIQIFCGGGPSHIDMYDPKPNAPREIRGEFDAIPTNVPGIYVSEHLSHHTGVMDKLAIVRTVAHSNSVHLPSSHLVLTGYEAPQPPKDNHNPFPGSIISQLRGPNEPGLPAYVAVPRRVSFGTAAYLGAAYNPFTTDNDPNTKDFHVRNLALSDELTLNRIHHRSDLLKGLDRLRRDIDLNGSCL